MTISEAVIKIESLMEKDMELARRIEDIRNNLMKRGKRNTLLPLPLLVFQRNHLSSLGFIFDQPGNWSLNTSQCPPAHYMEAGGDPKNGQAHHIRIEFRDDE